MRSLSTEAYLSTRNAISNSLLSLYGPYKSFDLFAPEQQEKKNKLYMLCFPFGR